MTNTKPKRIFLSPPHMGGEELRFVRETFDSNYIAPIGPMVDAFEQEFAEKVGIPYAIALSSGTAAMHLALRILGVGPAPVKWSSPQRNGLGPRGIGFARLPLQGTSGQAFHGVNISRGENLTGQGDEVFASTLTFIGSVTLIVFQGGIPVFVDSDRSVHSSIILKWLGFK